MHYKAKDVMHDGYVADADSLMREFNRGSIEWTMGHALQGLGMDFLLELAKTSGRPVNWNAVIYDPTSPNTWREQLAWTEKANKEAPVFAVNICMPIEFEFTLETMGLFDQLPAWNEATVGTLEERRMKLGDPGRRAALKADSVAYGSQAVPPLSAAS